jgi:proteasome accessory factor B
VRRKFERDKRALAELGVILEYHPTHDGYSLSAESLRARPIHLGPTETMVLREAAATLTHDSGSPFAPDVRGALARVLGLDSPEFSGFVVHRATHDGPALRDTLGKLAVATWRRLAAEFTYRYVGGGDPHPRTVHPWGLFARRGYWYLVGWCTERRAERCFRVTLLDGARVPGLPDGAPQFDRPAAFDIRKAAQVATWDWEIEAPQEVVLDVDEGLVPLVARALGDARIEKARVHRRVTYEDGILAFAWDWLPHVRIVAPVHLANRFRSRVEAISTAHASEQ